MRRAGAGHLSVAVISERRSHTSEQCGARIGAGHHRGDESAGEPVAGPEGDDVRTFRGVDSRQHDRALNGRVASTTVGQPIGVGTST
jgi:hypothetical protein